MLNYKEQGWLRMEKINTDCKRTNLKNLGYRDVDLFNRF